MPRIGMSNQRKLCNKLLIKPCADFIVDQINARASLIKFDDANKLIKLAE